jgi:hypothetical protein
MRRLLLLGALLLTGCQNLAGPFQHRANPVQVDDPRLTIDEQKRLGRDRLALPEWGNVAPKTYSEMLPGPYGH